MVARKALRVATRRCGHVRCTGPWAHCPRTCRQITSTCRKRAQTYLLSLRRFSTRCYGPDRVFLSSRQAHAISEASFTRASVRSLRANMRCRFGALRGLLEGDARSRFLACTNIGNDSSLRPVLLEMQPGRSRVCRHHCYHITILDQIRPVTRRQRSF